MKHIRKKTFKTFVISKKNLSLACMILVCGMIMGILFFGMKTISNASDKISNVDEFYKSALESELPMPDNGKFTANIFKILLGFDIDTPEGILLANPIFDVVDTTNPSPEPEDIQHSPTQIPATSSPEYNIEEVKIAKGMSVSNKTKFSVNPDQLAKEALSFSIDKNDVQVLIVHTHTTESFTDANKTKYTSSDSDRSTDLNKSIVKVGEKITEVLNNSGIKTIHDKTVHDYPSFNGAYGRSLSTIQKNIKQHPSIKVVLDVHRDGLIKADGTKLKVTTELDGKKVAQVMSVIGTNGTGLAHENWRENLKFASKIQATANEKYPNLMRPLNLREERFNQHATLGSLILEVGSNGNTLDEAILGGEMIANVIASVLNNP